MQNKAKILEQFSRARDEVRALLPSLDIHTEIYPGWTIKEVLAHLAGWDDATILALKAFINGAPPIVPAIRGIDTYNSQTVAERTSLNYEQVVREWEWVRDQLNQVLDQFPDEKLDAIIVAPWGVSLTVAQLIEEMGQHEEEHAEAIRTRQANPGKPLPAH